MFGSQALDVAIGLVLSFFIVSLAASGVVELFSRARSKRARLLDEALIAMIPSNWAAGDLRQTSMLKSQAEATGTTWLRKQRKPSYVSAQSFADGVTELLIGLGEAIDGPEDLESKLPPELNLRLKGIVTEVGEDLTAIKAGLESWFDTTMARLEGSYKRWATALLFWIGLAITVGANVSTFHVAEDLWSDSATRAAVIESSAGVVAQDGADLQSFSDAVEALDVAQLPVGWGDEAGDRFGANTGSMLATIAGWLTTAVLVMLGAPFWFDLLTKLVSLRSSGSRPPSAVDDRFSATSALAGSYAADGGPRARRTTWTEDLYRAIGGR